MVAFVAFMRLTGCSHPPGKQGSSKEFRALGVSLPFFPDRMITSGDQCVAFSEAPEIVVAAVVNIMQIEGWTYFSESDNRSFARCVHMGALTPASFDSVQSRRGMGKWLFSGRRIDWSW
jgi:hypothetical protein